LAGFSPSSSHFLPYTPGFDTQAMDRTVEPCQNFYLYACGT